MSEQCCCHWGAAVGDRGMKGTGEWPEFECDDCPVHQQGLGPTGRKCRRHKAATIAHAVAAEEYAMGELGRTLIKWTCVCGTVSRWVQARYLDLSVGQHARAKGGAHA